MYVQLLSWYNLVFVVIDRITLEGATRLTPAVPRHPNSGRLRTRRQQPQQRNGLGIGGGSFRIVAKHGRASGVCKVCVLMKPLLSPSSLHYPLPHLQFL
ncbi:hypothetical protein E2C01_053573 [Portunus trituberculatus]|uniref:Uncharacterized protein n=1 Tax=Portunus trituberculatus TaxID=210409 RepID=A0A5B7GPK5_PORTR|nr:hypothetical protein [Portunus trituberculatus]